MKQRILLLALMLISASAGAYEGWVAVPKLALLVLFLDIVDMVRKP